MITNIRELQSQVDFLKGWLKRLEEIKEEELMKLAAITGEIEKIESEIIKITAEHNHTTNQ